MAIIQGIAPRDQADQAIVDRAALDQTLSTLGNGLNQGHIVAAILGPSDGDGTTNPDNPIPNRVTRVLYRLTNNPYDPVELGYRSNSKVYRDIDLTSEVTEVVLHGERIEDVVTATLATHGETLGFSIDTAYAQKLLIKGACTGHGGDRLPIAIDVQKNFAGQTYLSRGFPTELIFTQNQAGEVVMYGDEIPDQFTLIRSDRVPSPANVQLEIQITRTSEI